MKRVLQRVKLANARFYAYHGVFPQEQIIGTSFLVDIDVFFDRELRLSAEEDLNRTVNYAELHAIAQAEMAQTRKLLETVSDSMLARVQSQFPFVAKIRVCITKQHPPFGGDIAQAQVEVVWTA